MPSESEGRELQTHQGEAALEKSHGAIRFPRGNPPNIAFEQKGSGSEVPGSLGARARLEPSGASSIPVRA